jgi:hypothetical protein
VVPYDIRELLGFQKGAPEQVDVHGVTLEVFLEYDHGKKPSTKKYYPEPHHPSVSLMDVQKDFGENERNKGNRHGVVKQHRGSGDIGSGCYLSMLAISLRPTIPRNPEHLLGGTFLGFDYMKQGKYISGDERGGFKVAVDG